MHPDELFANHRHQTVDAFSECIVECHRLDASLWGLTQSSRTHLRLNFGSLVVAALFQGILWLAVPPDRDQPMEKSRNWYRTPHWDLKAVPSYSGLYLPLTNHRKAWKVIRTRHFAYLTRVSEKYNVLRSSSLRAHSEEALKALEFELRRTLPRPDHHR